MPVSRIFALGLVAAVLPFAASGQNGAVTPSVQAGYVDDAVRTTDLALAAGEVRASLAAYFSTRDTARLSKASAALSAIGTACGNMQTLDEDGATLAWTLGMRAATLRDRVATIVAGTPPTQTEANRVWSESIRLSEDIAMIAGFTTEALRESQRAMRTGTAMPALGSPTEAVTTEPAPQETTPQETTEEAVPDPVSVQPWSGKPLPVAEIPQTDFESEFQPATIVEAPLPARTIRVHAVDPVTTWFRGFAAAAAAKVDPDQSSHQTALLLFVAGGIGVGGVAGSGATLAWSKRRAASGRGATEESQGSEKSERPSETVLSLPSAPASVGAESVGELDGTLEESLRQCMDAVNDMGQWIDGASERAETDQQDPALFPGVPSSSANTPWLERIRDRVNLIAVGASVEATRTEGHAEALGVIASELRPIADEIAERCELSGQDGNEAQHAMADAVSRAKTALSRVAA